MIEIKIESKDSNQRVDKFIIRLLPGASKSLIYKQIRKKNITLNGNKINGSEILNSGDLIQLFFSDETFYKFTTDVDLSVYNNAIDMANRAFCDGEVSNVEVIYEDDNIILINKPSGVLTQSASGNEVCLNDWLLGYLMATRVVTKLSLASFKPSVLNRLDRNTSGIVIGSKSLLGANVISQMLKDRILNKYYLTYVAGCFEKELKLEGYHHKDELSNTSTIKASLHPGEDPALYDKISTHFKPIKHFSNIRLGDLTLIEVELITGKSHQIRSHLSSIGYPILGDHKYGDKKINHALFSLRINSQMLHAYKLVMPANMPEGMENLAAKTFTCNPPKEWRIIDGNLEE